MISNHYGSFLNLIQFTFIPIFSPKLDTMLQGPTGAKHNTYSSAISAEALTRETALGSHVESPDSCSPLCAQSPASTCFDNFGIIKVVHLTIFQVSSLVDCWLSRWRLALCSPVVNVLFWLGKSLMLLCQKGKENYLLVSLCTWLVPCLPASCLNVFCFLV